MKISRVPFAVSLALLAAAPPFLSAGHAAVAPSKPPAEGADPARDAWRAGGMSACAFVLRDADGVTADDVEATCGCALDRYASGRPIESLPVIVPARLRELLGSPLLACASEQRATVAAAVALRLGAPSAVAAAPVVAVPSIDSKPVETQAPDPAAPPKRSGSDLNNWLSGLSLPGWLTDSGLPLWAWALLGFIGLVFLRGLFRGGDTRDLIGPPPSMRLGIRHNPPEPRRADPPQRS